MSSNDLSLQVGDKYIHVSGLELVFLQEKKLKEIQPDAPNGDTPAYAFCWVDNQKHLNHLYFYGDQVEKWLKKVE